MNEINVKRMLLAGLAMLVVWVVVEVLVEQVFARFLFGQNYQEMWFQAIELREWDARTYWVNAFIALLNCTVNASLRPMYGVGTKTALITSAFGVFLGFSLFINFINLGLFPLKLGLMEAVFEAIEFPIAMIAGASIYEGEARWNQAAE
jgi:hypothetical protein